MRIFRKDYPADFTSLLHPGSYHQSPEEVLNDPDLASHEKRVILSAWASDLYAVDSSPWLRSIPGLRTTLRVGDILAALRALDSEDPPPRGGMAMRPVQMQRVRAIAA